MDDLDEIRVAVFIYLCSRRSFMDIVGMSIDSLAIFCGYVPNAHKDKINDRCKYVLNHFMNMNIFDPISDNFFTCKHNDFIDIQLNNEWMSFNNNFAKITYQEIEKILGYQSNTTTNNNYSIMRSKLFLLLSYIRVNKLRRTKSESLYPANKPEIFYKQYKDIAEFMKCGTELVSSMVKVLCDLNIIAIKTLERYQDLDSCWHTDVTVFVDKQDGYENELKNGEEFLKNYTTRRKIRKDRNTNNIYE